MKCKYAQLRCLCDVIDLKFVNVNWFLRDFRDLQRVLDHLLERKKATLLPRSIQGLIHRADNNVSSEAQYLNRFNIILHFCTDNISLLLYELWSLSFDRSRSHLISTLVYQSGRLLIALSASTDRHGMHFCQLRAACTPFRFNYWKPSCCCFFSSGSVFTLVPSGYNLLTALLEAGCCW